MKESDQMWQSQMSDLVRIVEPALACPGSRSSPRTTRSHAYKGVHSPDRPTCDQAVRRAFSSAKLTPARQDRFRGRCA